MPMDYQVFEPGDKELAEIIVKILEKRGYDAGYQRSYPQHAVFIKVDTKEEANKIYQIIKGFMERFQKQEGNIETYNYDSSIIRLGKLIPETPKKKRETDVEKIKERIEKEDW